MGNSRARAVYEALLSDNFRRPQTDSGLESFIRAKYEQKKYIAREWIPPQFPPKVDWDKEIEEELENLKRKKKSSTPSSTTVTESNKLKPANTAASINVIPAPLPKPHSPKNSRLDTKKNAATSTAPITTTSSSTVTNMDLLGLDTTSSSTALPSATSIPTQAQKPSSVITDTFDFFSDPVPPMNNTITTSSSTVTSQVNKNGTNNGNVSSLKQEEDDFFNQKSLENDGGKLTNDKILALYGNTTSPPQFNANFQQHQPQQPSSLQDPFFFGQPPVQQQSGPAGPTLSLFKTATPAQQQQQQQQFIPTAGLPSSQMFNGNNFANFNNVGFGTMQSQQINKLNEENIRKIESLNFNNFK